MSTHKGKRIKTLEELYQASIERRAIHYPCWHGGKQKHIPASFLLGLQGMMLLGMFKNGMFLYKKG